MQLDKIKQQLDIIQIAERYGFKFSGKGNRLRAQENLFRDDSTSSLDFFKDTQKFYDRGDESIKGDVFDLIARRENITIANAIAKAREMTNSISHLPQMVAKKPLEKNKKIINLDKLAYFAKQEIMAGQSFSPVEIEIQANNLKFLKINPIHHKLFETEKLDIKHQKRIKYIFTNIIGYSQHWRAPSIIIRDRDNKIVDLATYRPQKPENYTEWSDSKYIYKNNSNRGKNFIFPFEDAMIKIAKRKGYLVIGEGLKNAVNALVYDIPFFSIESTSNQIDDRLIRDTKKLINYGYQIFTAFDGDKAGEKAYFDFNQKLNLGKKIKNIVSFDSNIDFTTYMTKDPV